MTLERMGKYDLVRQLASGGMGAKIFLARDSVLRREVVVKVLDGDSRELDFFREREAPILADLAHPNIVAVYEFDFIPENRVHYLVMAYARGGTLEESLRAGLPDLLVAIKWMKQMGSALRYAHDKGVLHRDIKPQNIFLSEHGDIQIGDFGLARLKEQDTNPGRTLNLWVTPEYAAPERPQKPHDERADIYSLGCVFLQMLTGQLVRDCAIREVFAVHSPSVPAPVIELVVRMLAFKPADRPQDMGKVCEALDEIKVACNASIAIAVARSSACSPESQDDSVDASYVDKKIHQVFGKLAMDKGRLPGSGLTNLGVPGYVGEWVLERLVPGTGAFTSDEQEKLRAFFSKRLVKKDEQGLWKHMLYKGDTVKLLTYLAVEVEVSQGKRELRALVPALSLKDCHIPDHMVEAHRDLLRQGMWGITELVIGESKCTEVVAFEPLQASVNLPAFYETRKEFTADEWRHLLMMSAGYNPQAYTPQEQIWILARLLPVVERNLHIMELAPKGTGKSFVYENISPRVRLSSGDISRAKLFVNNQSGQVGLLGRYDVVVLDEIQNLRLGQSDIIDVLKTYLANNTIRRSGGDIASDCGLVLLANIGLTAELKPRSERLVDELPSFMQETALLDRFKGLIPGWEVPKFRSEMIARGLGLKSDYLSETLTAMRSELQHLQHARERIVFEVSGGIRDEDAICALTSGYLKLLFPDLKVGKCDFESWCLRPALRLRQLVRSQLCLLDAEYRQKPTEIVASAKW